MNVPMPPVPPAEGGQDVWIAWHEGDRVALRPLFSLADWPLGQLVQP